MSTMERQAHATDEPVNVLVSRASRQISVPAAVAAPAGERQITEAGPPVPGQTVDSVRADVAETKEKAHR
ncbi:hypothetical protein OHA46_29645 [Streptomyces sp. NBC_00708]